MNLPAYLPLSDDQKTLLDSLRSGQTAEWASKQLLGRMRNFGLVDTSGDHPMLTGLGSVVAPIVDNHRLWFRSRNILTGYPGASGSCSCGDWKWGTNEVGADGKCRVRKAHAEHQAELIADEVR